MGSKDLAEPLRKAGLDVELDDLEFADVAWLGRGMGGKPVMIGVEFKRLSDLIQSTVSKRLQGHQIPGLLRTYDPDLTGQRVYLLVEGKWHKDRSGKLCRQAGVVWKPIPGAPTASVLRKQLLTLASRAGVTVWPTQTRAETIDTLADLYHYWTDADLDDHKSHLATYSPDVDKALLKPPSIFRHVIGSLPSVGSKVAAAAEERFSGCITHAINAHVDEWANLQTEGGDGRMRRFGTKHAEALSRTLKESHGTR